MTSSSLLYTYSLSLSPTALLPFSLPLICLARHIGIHTLDPLRVVSRQTSKNQHANKADRKLRCRRLHEDVDDHRHQQSNHTHDQERAECRQVLLGRVAKQAKASESRRRREEKIGRASCRESECQYV